MNIKDQIRAAIERLESKNNCGTSEFIESKRIAYEQVKEFLDSLPEQSVICSKDDYHWEGLKELLRDYQKTIDRQHNNMAYESVESYIDWIDSIPEQPVEGLEAEIDRLWESFSEEMSGPHNLFDMYRRLAHHFAEWGAEHAKK